MPDYFSHRAFALEVLKKFDGKQKSKISSRTLYLLGAQGGDLFFTYKLSFSKNNLGKILHNIKADILFEKLVKGNKSYAAGFATHYALDSIIHPIVYEFESKNRSRFAHYDFESDLGIYLSQKYNVTRRILPRDEVIRSTFAVYDSINKVESSVTLSGIERSLKRHYKTTEIIYRSRRIAYKFNYDYSSLGEKLEEAENLALNAINCVLDERIDKEVFSLSFLQK